MQKRSNKSASLCVSRCSPAVDSIRNSKGSVNPYVNWKDIADYEFLLPPKDQQVQLLGLLWAMDELIEKEMCLFNKAKQQFMVLKEQWLLQGFEEESFFSSARIDE